MPEQVQFVNNQPVNGYWYSHLLYKLVFKKTILFFLCGCIQLCLSSAVPKGFSRANNTYLWIIFQI